MQAKQQRDMKEKYVTLEEMYDILMRDEYKEFREENNVKLVTLEDGTRRLSRIINGYIVDSLPLVYRHIEAEEILIRDINDIELRDIGYKTPSYYMLYELWTRPLVWADPLENKDRVIDGRVAKEGHRSHYDWKIKMITEDLRDLALCDFADNPRLYSTYNNDSLDFIGIHSWSQLTADKSAIDRKIDNGGHYSIDDYRLIKDYDATCLRENLVIISRLRGVKRAAELLRMLQAEWPTLKRWKIYMGNISKEEIEEFEDILMNGFDDLLAEWEGEKTSVEEEENPEAGKPDSSFFAVSEKMTYKMCEKELIRVIKGAKNKAAACREILRSARVGYFVLSDKTDQEKADAINPWVAFTDKKYVFTGDDFRKARN